MKKLMQKDNELNGYEIPGEDNKDAATSQPDENTEYIELPEVKDIPGQEHIHPPSLGALADTAISSADEEDVLQGDTLDVEAQDDDVKIIMGTEADVTSEDLQLLDGTFGTGELDDTDEDGDALEEESELDIPGSENDDPNEDIGEEDEENNYYSLGSDDNDNLEQGE